MRDCLIRSSEIRFRFQRLGRLSKLQPYINDKASAILKDSGIKLSAPDTDFCSIEKNFFSFLFLYAFYRCGMEGPERIFYSAVNQSLRGMVTGCDNILDDEYKKTLDTDLPPGGTKFRSIIDIMVSDRVLFDLLLDRCSRGELTFDQVSSAHAASLSALAPSGVEEAEEEEGVDGFLPPDEILERVHHYKTGVLFLCPLALPSLLEEPAPSTLESVKNALYNIGMGCQVMDDMVDLQADLRMKRHNHMASLIHHGSSRKEALRLEEMPAGEKIGSTAVLRVEDFPEALGMAVKTARDYLSRGIEELLVEEHRALMLPAMEFLEKRIGAHPYMTAFPG